MPDNFNHINYLDISAKMVVLDENWQDTEEEYAISSIYIGFFTYNIPEANVNICVGVNALNDIKAKTPANLSSFMKLDRVAIYLKVLTNKKEKTSTASMFVSDWPVDYFKIFEGKIFSISLDYSRLASSAVYSIKFNILHRSYLLTCGSKLSGSVASSYSGNLTCELTGANSGVTTMAYNFEAENSHKIEELAMKDMWGAIKLGFSILNDRDVNKGILFIDAATNKFLDVKEEKEEIKLFLETINKDISKIELQEKLLGDNTSKQIKADWARTLDDFIIRKGSGENFYDTLVAICRSYELLLTFNSSSIIIVPTMSFSKNVYKTISTSEYSSINYSMTKNETIRGVCLIPLNTDAYNTTTGLGVNTSSIISTNNSCGMYELDNKKIKGKVAFLPAKEWLTLGNYVINDTIKKSAGYLTAKSMFLDLIAKNNKCSINSILRFDIMPGSLVKIQPPATFNEDAFLYATVESININIDTNGPQVSTVFNFKNVISPAEAKEIDIFVDTNPLYAKPDPAWIGGPICKI